MLTFYRKSNFWKFEVSADGIVIFNVAATTKYQFRYDRKIKNENVLKEYKKWRIPKLKHHQDGRPQTLM